MTALPPNDRSANKQRLSPAEIGKDTVQNSVEATAATVAEVTSLVTATIGEISRVIGGLATDLFEMRDAGHRAAADTSKADAVEADTTEAPESDD